MATVLTVDQKLTATVAFQDSHGNPATVDGVPVWSAGDATIAAITPAADGMSAVVAAGNTGSTQISVTADADLGSGIRSIVGTADIQVVGGEAVTAGLTLGTPEPK